MKKITLFIILAVLASLLAGCSGCSKTTTTPITTELTETSVTDSAPAIATETPAQPEVKNADMRKYKCSVCGHVYDPAQNNNISFNDLPATWQCPRCKAARDMFKPLTE